MDKMKDIKDAIKRERGKQRKKEIIARHQWLAETKFERNITPGPGEYHDQSTDMVNNTRGARKFGNPLLTFPKWNSRQYMGTCQA